MLKEKYKNLCIKLVDIFLTISSIILVCTLVIFCANHNKQRKLELNNNIKYKTELFECITNAKTIKEENLCILKYEIISENKLLNKLR
jgi:hypothetical protein